LGSEAYYFSIWNEIRRLAPQAMLLRGPSLLHPIQAASGFSDLDILVPGDPTPVRAFLKARGFYQVFKPQTYLERFRLRKHGNPEPYTIDLFKAERWGLGFRLAGNGDRPAEPRLACLVHAVADGKGTGYFERTQGGPPWEQRNDGIPRFGPVGRTLWRTGNSALLTLYLLLTGTIRPEMGMILRGLYRKAVYRAWQLTSKLGLEVAVVAEDRTTKRSVAAALLRLPASVKVVHMDFFRHSQPWLMRFLVRYNSPPWLQALALRCQNLARRVRGYFWAKKGWVVIYDCHLTEGKIPCTKSVGNVVKPLAVHLATWPVDMAFWLTGTSSMLNERDEKAAPSGLHGFYEQAQDLFQRNRIPFKKLDVSNRALDYSSSKVSEQILSGLRGHISIESAPGALREVLL